MDERMYKSIPPPKTGRAPRGATMARLRPSARPQVSAVPLHDELILFDERSSRTYVLNGTGARVWALCDGSRTLERVARAIASAYGLDERQAMADVQDLIDELERADLLDGR